MTGSGDARRRTAAGIGFAALAAGVGGAVPVYVGHMVQHIDPILLIVVVSILGCVLFNLVQLRAPRAYAAAVRGNLRDVLWVNVITLVAWGSSFAALRYVEPVLSNSASVGIEPIATLALMIALRRQASKILRSDVIASIAMLVIAGVQVGIMWSGRSGLGITSHRAVAIGVACVIGNGLANGALTVVPKRLFDGGMTRSQILASRMVLLVLGGVVYIAVIRPPIAPLADDLLGVAAAFFGVAGSLYLVQAAIQLAEPITVTLIISLNPIVGLGLQALDPRLAFSAATLVTTVVMVGLVVWSTLEQLRAKPAA